MMDGSVVERHKGFMASLAGRISHVLSAELVLGGRLYMADMVNGRLVAGATTVSRLEVRKLRNVRPLCLQRHEYKFGTVNTSDGSRLLFTGIGIEGEDQDGQRVRKFVAVHADGRIEIRSD